MASSKEEIKKLNLGIQVRDKLIGALLHECVEHKIPLPAYITAILETLYEKKLTKEGQLQ